MMNVRRPMVTFTSAVACVLLGGSSCGGRTGLDAETFAHASGSTSSDNGTDSGPDAAEVVDTNVPPSCQGGGLGAGNNCGASGMSDCCGSAEVPGGTFERTYDNGPSAGKMYPATVSGFRLDDYEITVGRFRNFVSAVLGGWRPATGSGKHTHLNGGRGLQDAASAATYESGWDASWNAELATTEEDWSTRLGRDSFSTWTSSVSTNERRPINLESWYEAYAFCIWDGGFLPSEAEWYYAASGGSEQRAYPWGSTAPGANADLAVYGCYYRGAGMICTDVQNIAEVGSVVAGDGKWGQSDLGGNLQEWNLDWFVGFSVPCGDCASVASGSQRVQRGGSFELDATYLLAATRDPYAPTTRYDNQSARCARSP
jgi:sulfatase modifying factor 1